MILRWWQSCRWDSVIRALGVRETWSICSSLMGLGALSPMSLAVAVASREPLFDLGMRSRSWMTCGVERAR